MTPTHAKEVGKTVPIKLKLVPFEIAMPVVCIFVAVATDAEVTYLAEDAAHAIRNEQGGDAIIVLNHAD
jgi:pyruvate/2-oxoacid:ferredoxin oxidoreductase beta subunit